MTSRITGARHRRMCFACGAGFLLVAAAQPLSAQTFIRPIVTELESSPTVLQAEPLITVSALLQSEISCSPNGLYWGCEVFTEVGTPPAVTTADAAISGTRAGVSWYVARGQNIPGLGVATDTGGIDERVLVNNAGDVSLSCNLTGPTSTDEAIIRWTRATDTYQFTAREGSTIGVFPGETYGLNMVQRAFLNDGRIAFFNSSTNGVLPSSADDFLFLSGNPPTVVAQNGGATPVGQSFTPPSVITALEDEFAVNATGTRSIYTALVGVGAAAREVAVVDGNVVLEIGQNLPGITGTFTRIDTISDVRMSASGRWAAHGRASDGVTTPGPNYLVVDGQVLFSGDVTMPGGFAGEAVISVIDLGFTTQGDLWYGVVTSFGRSVVMVIPVAPGSPPITAFETGSALDLNNNGDPFDDQATVTGIFSAALADDGTLYLITRNSAPVSQFQFDVIGWTTVDLPVVCRADINGQGGITVQDIFDFLAAWFAGGASGDFNGQGGITVQDIFDFLAAWFAGCP